MAGSWKTSRPAAVTLYNIAAGHRPGAPTPPGQRSATTDTRRPAPTTPR
ncbi:hypothetical protein [Streptomyces sp. NPDC050485]